jgi:uncharacterized protein YbjQ (UPF0145 family)
MATNCISCGKSKNLLNEHLFKTFDKKVYCIDCYSKIAKEEKDKLSSIIMTTTNNIDGYLISKYIGIDSSEVVIGTGVLGEFVSDLNDFMGERSTNFEKKIQDAKEIVFNKLKRKALDKGANAIVGIDIDYTEFTGNKIGIIANGTLVIIEKIDK